MKKYENANYIVEVTEEKVIATSKRFGDRYTARIENGKLRANSSLALNITMKLKAEFGF